MEQVIIKYISTPAGGMIVGSFGDELCLCDWHIEQRRVRVDNRIQKILQAQYVEGTSSIIEKTIVELEEYFTSRRKEFDIPIRFTGSDFQNRVWMALRKISYGQTLSYGTLARNIGQPHAVRAVANAVGANPISILVPCHRVIGSDGSLTGFGGGLPAKRYLLGVEGVLLQHEIFE
jgi:methylated-DNA-[protein]-cysteine S-methyltransferase